MRKIIKLISAHISGDLSKIPAIGDGQIYMFYFTLLLSLLALIINAFIATPGYEAIAGRVSFINDAGQTGFYTACLIAVIAFMMINHIAGITLDNAQNVERGRNGIETFTAVMIVVALCGMDVWVNLKGAQFRAREGASTEKAEVDKYTDKSTKEIDEIKAYYTDLITQAKGQNETIRNEKCPRSCPHKVVGGAAHYKGYITEFGAKAIRANEQAIKQYADQRKAEIEEVNSRYAPSKFDAVSFYETTLALQKTFWEYSAVGLYIVAFLCALWSGAYSRRVFWKYGLLITGKNAETPKQKGESGKKPWWKLGIFSKANTSHSPTPSTAQVSNFPPIDFTQFSSVDFTKHEVCGSDNQENVHVPIVGFAQIAAQQRKANSQGKKIGLGQNPRVNPGVNPPIQGSKPKMTSGGQADNSVPYLNKYRHVVRMVMSGSTSAPILSKYQISKSTLKNVKRVMRGRKMIPEYSPSNNK